MRKIVLILLAVFAVGALSAFNQGTINPGGYVAISSVKYDSDDDATTGIVIAPQIGYFVIDNLSADLMLSLGMDSQSGDYAGEDYKDSSTSLGIGLGARYFFLNFYGGLGFNYESYSNKPALTPIKYSSSAMYITPKIGYVLPLASNVYADLGLNYRMGIGKVKGTSEIAGVDSDWDYDNEYSKLQFRAGLQIFFPSK